MSFYKEELAGETKNYIHLRAVTEERSAIDVLRQHANELLVAMHKVELLMADDQEFIRVWRNYAEASNLFFIIALVYLQFAEQPI